MLITVIEGLTSVDADSSLDSIPENIAKQIGLPTGRNLTNTFGAAALNGIAGTRACAVTREFYPTAGDYPGVTATQKHETVYLLTNDQLVKLRG